MPEVGTRRALLVAGALAVVAAVLRLPGLDGGLWLDEIATILNFVRLPAGEIATSYASPNNHVLYSLMAHASITLFGESAWSVRLPAYLFGVATVPAVFVLARAWLAERESLGVALIVAVSYHHVYFSQNARGYTGFVFFSVLSTLLLTHAVRVGGRRLWIAYGLAAALNVYVLLSGLFVAVAQVIGVLALHVLPAASEVRRSRLAALAGGTAVAAAVTLLLYAPLLREMVHFYTTADADVGWLPSAGLLAALMRSVLPTTDPVLLTVGLMVGTPVLVAGLIRTARRAPLAFFAFLLPPVIELGVALALGAGSYPRRFLLVMPFAAMVGVTGVHAVAEWVGARLRQPRLAAGLFAAGLVVGLVAVSAGLPRLYRVPKQDFEGALAWVADERGPDDLVVAAWTATGPAIYYDPEVGSARTRGELEAFLAQGRRVWLLGSMLADLAQREPSLAALVEERFSERARFEGLVGDGDVIVFVSDPS